MVRSELGEFQLDRAAPRRFEVELSVDTVVKPAAWEHRRVKDTRSIPEPSHT